MLFKPLTCRDRHRTATTLFLLLRYFTSQFRRPVHGSTAEQLKAYRVNVTPPQNIWVEVDDRVFFQQITQLEEGEHSEGKNASKDLKKKASLSYSSNTIQY